MLSKEIILINCGGYTVNNKSNTFMWIPYGLLSIASYLKNKGIKNVKIIDLNHNNPDLTVIKNTNPLIIGISSTTPEFSSAVNIARKITMFFPHIPIVFGGIHSSLFPKEIIKKFNFISAIIVGEGEELFHKIIERIFLKKKFDNIRNVVTQNNLKYFEIYDQYLDIDKIPFPDYDILDGLQKYINYSKNELGFNALHMVATRGCVYNCSFCSVKHIQGNKYRTPNPEALTRFWSYCLKKYKIEGFWLKDSDFTLNWKWLDSLLSCIDNHRLKVKLSINANIQNFVMNNKEVPSIDLNKLELLNKIGVKKIWFGIETGSEKIRARINKNINNNFIKELTIACVENEIDPCGFFMIGFKDETIDDIRQTFHFMDSLPLQAKRLHILQPLPGSSLYKQYQNENTEFFTGDIYFSNSVISTRFIDFETIKAIYGDMINYFYYNGPKPSWSNEANV